MSKNLHSTKKIRCHKLDKRFPTVNRQRKNQIPRKVWGLIKKNLYSTLRRGRLQTPTKYIRD